MSHDALNELLKLKNKIYKTDDGGEKNAITREDYFQFFNDNYPESRKCLLKNTVLTKNIDPERGWCPIQNYRDEIESLAITEGFAPAHVKRHLAAWCMMKKRELLVDIPEWDGVDHIGDALDRMYVTNIEHAYFVELMKEWFANVVLRLHDSSHQNRCVIFRGKQGIGKDFAIKKITSGFGLYANEIEFSQSKTEIYRIIKGLAIGIIPEFDETHKSTLATVKSVITADSAETRALYKNEAESVKLHTSFISASNFKYILRDSTGNRRFMIFNIERMDHTFEQVSGAQIAAQAFALAQENFRATDAAQTAMRKIILDETPPDSDDLFIDEIRDIVKRKQSSGGQNGSVVLEYRVEWADIKNDVYEIARRYNFGLRRAQSIIKSDNIWHRDRDGVHYSVDESDGVHTP